MENKKEIKCPDCQSPNGYMRMDGTWFCRRCGEISKLREESQ